MSRLTELLAEGMERGFYAGVAAIVSDEAEILVEHCMGDARSLPDTTAASAETLWDLASLTKPLAGAPCVLALAAERHLALDDPLSRFSDAFKKTRFEGVTIRRLLSHSAGLQDWFPCYVRGEGRTAYRRTLSELDAAAKPGTETRYSCLGYLLLADVVEKVSASPLDLFFHDRLSGPLGLARDLLFKIEGTDLARAAGGERDDATERRMVAERGLSYAGFRTGVVNGQPNDGNAYRRAGGVSLNAGLFGTARAVAAVGRAWLTADARLLGEAWIAEAIRNQTPDLGADRGLGWELASSAPAAGDSLSTASYGHTGFTGASLFVDPVARRVNVLLANRLHPDARPVDMNDFRRRFHQAANAS